MRRRVVTFLAVAATTAVATMAPAQEPSAMAEALYREGKALMDSGRVPEACIKFAESHRVDPATGTLLNLANCHEKEGKTATAWAEFSLAAANAKHKGQTERATFASDRAADLEKKLRSLAVDVKRAPPGMVVKLDDQVLGAGALGTPLPTDPGEHRLTVSAPGKKTWVQAVTLAAGPGTTRVEVPALEDEPTDARPIQNVGHGRRNAGLVIGGAGVLALGAGVFLGVRSILLDNQADREESRAAAEEAKGYPGNPNIGIQRDASARDRDDASMNRTMGLIASGVGVAAIGAGIYFLVTAKGSHSDSAAGRTGGLPRWMPLVGPHTRGASLSFTF